jgi:acyl carrier protein
MKENVREKIATFLNQPVESIKDDAVLTSLVPESFLLVELVIELQEEFGVRLMQDDLKDVKTVRDLASVIERNLQIKE